jgi:putative chitinase
MSVAMLSEPALVALLRVVWGCPTIRAELHAGPMLQAMQWAGINTPRRLAHWLGQLGHESGRGRYTREIWGPTPQQRRYEPTTTLSQTLGNVRPGDGARYMGRGLIQLTGRANYRAFTARAKAALGADTPDFETLPRLLETSTWASFSAADYWRARDLNRWADADDIVTLTKRINGGTNGLADRHALTARATATLASPAFADILNTHADQREPAA